MTLMTTSSRMRLMSRISSSPRRWRWPNAATNSLSFLTSFRSLTRTSETLDIETAQHIGGGFVELFGAPHVLETVQQIVGAQALPVGAAEIVDDAAAVHHDQPIAQIRRLR